MLLSAARLLQPLLALSLIVLSAGALASPAGQAFTACPQHFHSGFAPLPVNGPGMLRGVCFTDFAVLHSGQSKTPVYVAQHLTPQSLARAKSVQRNDRFYEEARLPAAERARLSDYRGSGYDRGHMAEAAAMPSEEGMAQSFSLANIVPQAPQHNRGLWASSVERATRHFVERGNEVYVFTGPLFSRDTPPKTIGEGQVWVPEKLFKLVYVPGQSRAWVHVSENRDEARAGRPWRYEDFVAYTGVEWLPEGAIR